jgi:cytochrome c oxidase subunit 3
MSHAPDSHPEYLQHHFETPTQQFEAGKLGIWLFLATEILLFGGLFVAYAVYRANHPEIFLYAHQYLDKVLGGTNTVVLLCSSLTMAWAVRAAQLGQRKLLMLLLSLTLLGGFGFMGIKAVEYKAKWEHGLLPGPRFAPHDDAHPAAAHAPDPATHPQAGGQQPVEPAAAPGQTGTHPPAPAPGPGQAAPTKPAPPGGAAATAAPRALVVETSKITPSAAGPAGTVRTEEGAAAVAAQAHLRPRPSNVQIFFGIYFLMTGLHGIHVLIGMGAIAWILVRSARGDFSPEYFTPVDFVGLYWHLVDLIWIFLFPLLYLIG